MKYELRPYQAGTIDGDDEFRGVYQAWEDGVQRPAAVLCTGAGKTVIFSALASRIVRVEKRYPLILVHREELADQTIEKLEETDPGLSIGMLKAERHEIDKDIVVASVQTLCRRLGTGKLGVPSGRFTDIITDECHHGTAPSYQNIYRHFGGLDPLSGTRMLGVTATLSRSDGSPLGGLWQEVVYEYGTVRAMEEKYLVPAHAERVVLKELDLSKIKSIGGDYSVEALGGQMFQAGAQIAQTMLEKGRKHDGTLRRFISFAPTVLCARFWAQDFADAGIKVAVITGETPTEVRKAAYAAVAAGTLHGLINCMVLTEGFDLPAIEMVHIGRPTKSMELYTQMVGRGLRRSDKTGKRDCLILDTVGTIVDKLKTLINLGLPPRCECACDCELEHLCALSCNCPRDRKGKLKKPCIVCYREWKELPRDQRERCPHYVAQHVIGCRHKCDGLGRPGKHDPDEMVVILDPEEPDPSEILIDGNEIETTSVDLFERGGGGKAKRLVAAKRAPKPKAWRTTTKSGRPYLPSQTNFEFWIFLHEEVDGTWTVGEKPSRGGGKAVRIASGLSFKDAVLAAEDNHPTGGKLGRPLVGLPSEGQLKVLVANNVEIPNGCDKQQASDLLSDLFATRALD